ncbi:MAG: P1 family peptidase [Clostridia bacterium]|nr:P1 family peptidase [Clostridia bacterium]
MYQGYLTDIDGIEVGHAVYEEGQTGVTAIICRTGATAGCDVRGSAPGTREIALLESEKIVQKIHSVVLSGGSAFGLSSSSGVMNYLEMLGVGFDVQVTTVPIVCGAVIFDLDTGNFKIRPDEALGKLAAESASKSEQGQGKVGVGLGASVGKLLGPDYASPSGLGSATVTVGDLKVSALVVVNAAGNVYDFDNTILSGAFDSKNNRYIDLYEHMKQSPHYLGNTMANTTLAVVATNGDFSKPECNKIAQMAQNALARRIKPVHTSIDGDTVFALSTNSLPADMNLAGTMAVEALEKAIINAVMLSKKY